MLEGVARITLAAVLAAAAALKVADPRASQAALSTFGIGTPPVRRAAFVAIVAWELALAAGVAAGLDVAAFAAAGTLTAFAAVLLLALRRGRSGAPCACFGSRSRVSAAAVARNLGLAAAFAALPFVPDARLSATHWLALGLGVALLGVLGLTVAVLALAREIGVLRLAIGPQSALEIPEEGPELGSRTDVLAELADASEDAEVWLAVFTSEGCRVCQALEPAVAHLARDPLVSVRTFDERRDPGAWRRLDVPGSPFAVALDRDGTVLAKGTFNTLPQLEGVVATAERRLREAIRA
ncbi:MAG: hypothetical protein H0X56_05405 [Solirubrobacterales bacterium]|jgi:hypothetical protein|nr:hypothetical protein [Thermoleophilaceae bacterium]MBA3861391.1 hypothetical protein [Solirubrobacterales bacterium]